MDSTVLLYVTLGIIVLGFIILGIGIALLIAGAKEPIKEMKGRVDSLKERADKLALEATSLQHTITELQEDIQSKTENITNFVDAAKGTMNSVLDLNSSVNRITGDVFTKVDRDRDSIAQVNMWTNSMVGLLNLWDNRKNLKTGDVHYRSESPKNDGVNVIILK